MRDREIRHPARMDDADRRRHTTHPVSLILGIVAVAIVLAALAILNTHGIDR